MKLLTFIVAISSIAILQAQSVEPDSNLLMKHVQYFASSELNGRLPGTEGYNKAVRYAIEYLEANGVQPISPQYWPQSFPIDVNEIVDAHMYIGDSESKKELKPGVDFSVRGYSGAGSVTSEIIFCGYGFDNGAYNDYESVDVNGKIVMVFKGSPSFIDGAPRLSIREKADIAYRKGAKAIIFVSEPNSGRPQYQPIGSVMHGDGPMHRDMPQVQVSIDIADQIVRSGGKTLSQLQKYIDSLHISASFDTRMISTIKVITKYEEHGESKNIVGLIQGHDPDLKDEYIVVGAHLDHVGSIGNYVYYPGANDNASGSAAVLELARIFSKYETNMKRSMLFVLFGSEEKGLVGSEYLAENFPVNINQIVAMFNMDCIAYGDSIQVGNGKSNPGLWKLAVELDSLYVNRMVKRTWSGGGADLTPFHNKGVPGLYFVTTNSYDYLHLPGDTPETLNVGLYTDLVKLVALMCYEIGVNGRLPKNE